jgi:hypothetical protein
LCVWIGGAVLLAAAAFLLGTPYALLDFSHFWDPVQDELRHAHEARTLDFEGTSPGWVYYLLYGFPAGLGGMGTLAALVGLGVAGARRERGDVLLLTWCFLFYFVVGAAKDHFIRYLIPLLPALAVLTARWLWLVWSDGETLEARQPANPPTRQRFRLGRVVAGLVAVLVVLSCGIKSLAYLRLFDPPDARTEVAQWFRQTVPPGTRVGLSDWPWFYTPPLVPANGGSADAARDLFVKDPESGRYAWVWLRFQPEVLEQEKPEWVVLTDFEYGPRVRLGQATVLSFMQQLEKDYSLIRCLRRQPTFLGLTFDRGLVPHDWRYLNPEVRVYRIRLTSRSAAPSPARSSLPAPGRHPPPRRSADRRRCVRAWRFRS